MQKQASSTPQTDNIYNVKPSIVIAAIGGNWDRLWYFDGRGWVSDLANAKKYLTIKGAMLDIEADAPTAHSPEIWRVAGERLTLLAGEGSIAHRSRPTVFAP